MAIHHILVGSRRLRDHAKQSVLVALRHVNECSPVLPMNTTHLAIISPLMWKLNFMITYTSAGFEGPKKKLKANAFSDFRDFCMKAMPDVRLAGY